MAKSSNAAAKDETKPADAAGETTATEAPKPDDAAAELAALKAQLADAEAERKRLADEKAAAERRLADAEAEAKRSAGEADELRRLHEEAVRANVDLRERAAPPTPLAGPKSLYLVRIEGNPEAAVEADHQGDAVDLYEKFYGILESGQRRTVDPVTDPAVAAATRAKRPGPIARGVAGRVYRLTGSVDASGVEAAHVAHRSQGRPAPTPR